MRCIWSNVISKANIHIYKWRHFSQNWSLYANRLMSSVYSHKLTIVTPTSSIFKRVTDNPSHFLQEAVSTPPIEPIRSSNTNRSATWYLSCWSTTRHYIKYSQKFWNHHHLISWSWPQNYWNSLFAYSIGLMAFISGACEIFQYIHHINYSINKTQLLIL